MTFSVTIGPPHHDTDSSFTDEDDSVQVAPPSSTGSRDYRDPYDEWAGFPYPDELKPNDSARRPRTTRRARATGRRRLPSPESPESASPTQLDNPWLICSGDKDKDITVHLDLDVGLDISHDLERLARLSRLGHFNQAVGLFEERLAPHVDFFPVVAEYTDLLLEQENFGHLHRFTSSRLSDPLVKYSDDEVLLLKVLKSLAEIYTRGALIPALEMTTEALKNLTSKLSGQSSLFRHPAGTEIQLMEACVRIIAHAATHSNFLESEPFQSLMQWSFPDEEAPWRENNSHDYHRTPSSRSIYRHRVAQPIVHPHVAPAKGKVPQRNSPQIGPWYRLLVKEGFLWESHRILRAILPLFWCSHGHYIDYIGFEEFAQLDDISKAGDVFLQPGGVSADDEQVLLTDFANASLLASFLSDGCFLESVRTAHGQFQNSTHSLASVILSTNPHLIKSRPYLNWALFESTRGLSTSFPLPVNQQRPLAEIWSHGVLSRVQSLQQRNPSTVEGAGLTQTPSNSLPYRNLDTVFASAKDLGDYRLEKSVLQKIYQLSRDFGQRLQAVQALTKLHHDTLQDVSGYLQCLIDEFLLLDSGDPTGREGMRKDLHRRLAEFDGSFPFRFDYNEALRHNSAIVFFDNPLLKWMERRVSYLLLASLGRDVEAELARVQLPSVECYLPRHIISQLNPSAVHHERENHSGAAQTPVVAAEEKSEHPARWSSVQEPVDRDRAPRAILPEKYRSGTATDDVVENLENLIKLATKERKEREAEDKMQQVHEIELAATEERRRIAEERANKAVAATQNMQSLILKDPKGRNFQFPFDQSRTLSAFQELMQQVLHHDAILSHIISKSDYELIGPDGSPISREDWDSVVHPGSIITMRFKPDPGQKPSQTPERDDFETRALSKTETKPTDEDVVKSVDGEYLTREQDISVRVDDEGTEAS